MVPGHDDGNLHVAILARSVIAHFPAGGMELHTEVLRRGLTQRGHVVTTLTTPHPDGTTQAVVDPWGETRFVGAGPPGAYSRAWWRESVLALLDLHARHPIDVVVSQSGGAFGYLRAKRQVASGDRLPVILITHNNVASSLEDHLSQGLRHPVALARWLPRALPLLATDARMLRRADYITSLSPHTADAMRRWLRLPAARVVIIPNGVDVQAYQAAAAQRESVRSKLRIADHEVVILGMGRLVLHKGFGDLVEAFSRLVAAARADARRPPGRLVLVGDGPARESLAEQIERLGLGEQVLFTGQVPSDQVASLLWASDVVALPSFAEGVPLSVLEAMACARPVVATRVGGIPSVVHDGRTGLLVPPHDAPALARALDRLIGDHALSEQLGARAQALAWLDYDQRVMLDRYERVVRRAGDHRHSSTATHAATWATTTAKTGAERKMDS